MAIRPTDFQLQYAQQIQTPPTVQRVEEAPHANQAAAQTQFENKVTERNETISESGEARGNKIEVGERAPDREAGGKGRKRERKPGDPFDEVVEEDAGLSDGEPHLIDFTA